MPSQPVPEESVEAVMAEWTRCLNAPEGELYAERQGDEAREHLIARRMVEVAQPAIRKQEREQVLEEVREGLGGEIERLRKVAADCNEAATHFDGCHQEKALLQATEAEDVAERLQALLLGLGSAPDDLWRCPGCASIEAGDGKCGQCGSDMVCLTRSHSNQSEAESSRLRRALEELRNGPDTLTPDGLRIVNAAIHPDQSKGGDGAN